MSRNRPGDRNTLKKRRLTALLVVLAAVVVSWPVIAGRLLGIEREIWLWIPFYLLFIVLYWFLAWGAIAGRLEDLPDRRNRWLKGSGCLALALVVFILMCALLAVVFTG